MSLGKKLCLFVCYVKHVDNRRWVDKGVASIQWRQEVGCCWTNIRSGVEGQRKTSLFLLLKLLQFV